MDTAAHQLHPPYRDISWKETVKGGLHRFKSIPSGTLYIPALTGVLTSQRDSIQDALRTFLPPIKREDTRLDFYTVYKKEAMEYDTDYVKKYDEDLNTTLIFVRLPPLALCVSDLLSRRVCSPRSVPPLSSTLSPISNPTRTTNLHPSSARSFSPSINPPSRVKPPSFRLSRRTRRGRLLQPPDSCTRAF